MYKSDTRQIIVALMLVFGLFLATGAYSRSTTDFDHFSTGFPLTGGHQNADCDACHTRGVFKGTPRRCAACHATTSRMSGERKPPNHMTTSDNCESCHSTFAWSQVTRFDHGDALGTCVSCHDGRTAPGKTPSHVQSGNNCEDCHSTAGWQSARFDHSNVTGNCISCHNGVTATGKGPRHIQSANLCEDCHRTTGWSPVTRVEQAEVIGS